MQGTLWKLSEPPLRSFQKRHFVADGARAQILYWHDVKSSATAKHKAINVFTLDRVQLQEGIKAAASKSSQQFAGTITLELRKGHSGQRTIVLAAETIDDLHAWHEAVHSISRQARALPMRHLVEQVSALRLATLSPARQGWLWKRRNVIDGALRRWFVLLRPAADGVADDTAGEALLLYYTCFTSDEPSAVLPLAACAVSPIADRHHDAGCAFELRSPALKRPMHLAADASDECAAWMRALLLITADMGATPTFPDASASVPSLSSDEEVEEAELREEASEEAAEETAEAAEAAEAAAEAAEAAAEAAGDAEEPEAAEVPVSADNVRQLTRQASAEHEQHISALLARLDGDACRLPGGLSPLIGALGSPHGGVDGAMADEAGPVATPLSAEELARLWAEELLLHALTDELASRIVRSFLLISPAEIEALIQARAEGADAAHAVCLPSATPPDVVQPPSTSADGLLLPPPLATGDDAVSERAMIAQVISWLVGCPILGISSNAVVSARPSSTQSRPSNRASAGAAAGAATRSTDKAHNKAAKAREALSAALQLKSLLDKKRVASGIASVQELRLHKVLASGLRLRCRTALLDRYAECLALRGPIDHRVVSAANELVAQAEQAQRGPAAAATAPAARDAPSPCAAPADASGDMGSAPPEGGAAGQRTATAPRDASPALPPALQVATPVAPAPAPAPPPPPPRTPPPAAPLDCSITKASPAHEKRSSVLRRQLATLVKRQASALGGSITPLMEAVLAAPQASQLPPPLRQALSISRELGYYFIAKKLTVRRAKKVKTLLALLPIRTLAGLLTRGSNATRVLKAIVALMLARPPGGGASVLQRFFATSLDLAAQEKELHKLLGRIPPATRRVATWLLDHRGDGWLPSAAAFDTDEKLAGLLVRAAAECGASAALTVEWSQPGLVELVHVYCALMRAQALDGGREIHAVIGTPAFEKILTSLLPLLHEPILRIALLGNVPQLLQLALPKVDVILKAAINQQLPADQRTVAIALAVQDLAEAAYAYVHGVVRAAGTDSELHELLQWLLSSWQATQQYLDLEAVMRSAQDAAATSAAARGPIGHSTASSTTWEGLLAKVHRVRANDQKHGQVFGADETGSLLSAFVKQLGF